jgi:hypothetical protein
MAVVPPPGFDLGGTDVRPVLYLGTPVTAVVGYRQYEGSSLSMKKNK